MEHQSTIVAVSTPAGEGGIAVIRLSGPEAIKVADKLWHGKPLHQAASHTAHYGSITDICGTVLDRGVATLFRNPGSYTGEDTVELSIHGSKWLQAKVVEELCKAGATPASPGEFTQRAFKNGRIDLAQAEAVADIISAHSAAAHRLAATQMNGTFSKRLDSLRERMVELASLLELELDFSEEDVEFADRTRLMELTRITLDEVNKLASTFRAGRAIRDGVNVVIAGAPNAGKSTLLNALCGEEKAIVTDIPGTTRDTIEDTVEIEGILFRFTDTAGLRQTDDPVESKGIERTHAAMKRAAIILWLRPCSEANEAEKFNELLSGFPTDAVEGVDSPVIMTVATKCDLAAQNRQATAATFDAKGTIQSDPDGEATTQSETIRVSAKEGTGMDELKRRLARVVESWGDGNDSIIVTNERHYRELSECTAALTRVEEGLREGLPSDLTAQDLREAISHLASLTGAITTDNLLSTIFSRFCIGK